MNVEIQASLIYFPGLEPEHREAVRMMCSFYELYPKIFQERSLPYKIPKSGKDPRKLYLFKCCLQAIKELEQKNGPEPRIWIIAQLKTLRIMDINGEVYLSGDCFYGEKAWSRWKIFEAHAKKQASRVISQTPLKIKTIIDGIQNSHNLVSENLELMLNQGKIRIMAKSNKISKVYLSLHPDVVEFARKNTWNSVGFDPIEIAGLDNKEILQAFETITNKKPVGPSL